MTEHQIARVVAEFCEQLWALHPAKLAAVQSLLYLRAAGVTVTEADLHARMGEPRERPPLQVTSGGVGVLPVFGVLSQRMNLLHAMSGGTSTEQLTSEFRAFRDDPKVKAILLAVDSPGGSTYGIEELATEIREGRRVKPVHGVASSLAASAGYWLLAQCDKAYVTPGGDVGSIGVYAAHEDMSDALQKAGVKVTLVSSSRYKTEGNPFGPLTEEAHAAMKARVDAADDRFVSAVALGRGVSETTVRTRYGEGRVLHAKDALAAGMVDGIATLDAHLERLDASVPRATSSGLRASSEPSHPSSVTPHEPSPVTGHEHHADTLWRQRLDLERRLLEF